MACIISLLMAYGCRTMGSQTTAETSKLKFVADDKYILKLVSSSKDERLHHFEACYADGSSCVDALQYLAGNSGSSRVYFSKENLSDLQSRSITKDFGKLLEDSDKAMVYGASIGTGASVAHPAGKALGKPMRVLMVAPPETLEHLSVVIKDLNSEPLLRGKTIGEAKALIKKDVDALKRLGLDPSVANLGDKTKETMSSRIADIHSQKGHLFSDEFAAYLRHHGGGEMGARVSVSDILSFKVSEKDFDLARYLKTFLESKGVTANQAFDVRAVLDSRIAAEYIRYQDLADEFAFMSVRPEYVNSLYEPRITLYVTDKFSARLLYSPEKAAGRFSKLLRDIHSFEKSGGTPASIFDGLNNVSRRARYGAQSWHGSYDSMKISRVADYIGSPPSKRGLYIFKDLLSSRVTMAMTIVAAAVAGGSFIVRGMEASSPPINVLTKYPSLADPSSTTRESASDIVTVLTHLALLVQTHPLPPIQVCTPDQCSQAESKGS